MTPSVSPVMVTSWLPWSAPYAYVSVDGPLPVFQASLLSDHESSKPWLSVESIQTTLTFWVVASMSGAYGPAITSAVHLGVTFGSRSSVASFHAL